MPFMDLGRRNWALSNRVLSELLKAVLDKGGEFRFRANGLSMSPFIRHRDIITVSSVPEGTLRIGDIVAFLRSDKQRFAVHRVEKIERDGVFIKGDNTAESDGLIPMVNILGRVSSVERNGKQVALGLGPERRLIPFLTRPGLRPWLRPIWRFLRPIVRP